MSLQCVLAAFISAAIGFLMAWLMHRSRGAVLYSRLEAERQDLAEARNEIAKHTKLAGELKERVATLETTAVYERSRREEQAEVLGRAGEAFRDSFQALAAAALKSNNQAFLDLAKTNLQSFQVDAKSDLESRQSAVANLIAPVEDALRKMDSHLREVENRRSEAYGELRTQVQSLTATQERLRLETGNLVKALRTPAVRGRWGEIQLKRVVELAGMLNYCDFTEQETVQTPSGRIRPDLVVKLPGAKCVVVDAKTPLMAYIEALEAPDEELRKQRLLEHARQVRHHLNQLSSKSYWEQFESTPEFVVMFLPGETFFSAALEQDPALIEYGVGKSVIPASPTTLIALLKAIAYGWNQEKLARNAQQISALGKELHDRLRSLGGHLDGVGRGLDRAVEAYNKAIGSLEARVMVSARKFVELGAPVTEEIAALQVVETTARNLTFDFDDPGGPEETDTERPERKSISQGARDLGEDDLGGSL